MKQTGRQRYRILRRLFRPDLLVLQIEIEEKVKIFSRTPPPPLSQRNPFAPKPADKPRWEVIRWWKDASPANLLPEPLTLPIAPAQAEANTTDTEVYP